MINPKNIDIVIIEPHHPGNIGSVCRACKNMGVSQVILVNPAPFKTAETYRLGWGAHDVIDRIQVVQSFTELLPNYHCLIGTTNRPRENQVPTYTPEALMPILGPISYRGKIAIVFGRESNGLTNAELTQCNYLSQIPSAVAYPALNLSQAVLIYARAIFMASRTPNPESTYQNTQDEYPNQPYQWQLATHAEQEHLYETLATWVDTLPFKTRHGSPAFVRLIRRILGRTQLESRDVRLLLKLISAAKKNNG